MEHNLVRTHFLTFLVSLAFGSCSPERPSTPLKEEVLTPDKPGLLILHDKALTPKESLERLEKILTKNPDKKHLLEDILTALKAEEATLTKGSPKFTPESAALWKKAMAKASSMELGKITYEKWLESYAAVTGKVLEADIFAQLVLAETQNGQLSIYMREKNLVSPAKVIKSLRKIVPQWVSTAGAVDSLKAPSGIPTKDPLLTATAKSQCQAQSLDVHSWAAWNKNLSQDIRTYFEALVTQCQKKSSEAVTLLAKVASDLKRKESTAPYALEALSRLASLQRSLGQRRDAAETYLTIAEVWDMASISPKTLGLSEFEFAKRKINDLLWGTRYRALISDYENAKSLGQKAIAETQEALSQIQNLSSFQKTELEDLRAEAYHTLSNRIAVEKKQWESARSLNLTGLSASDLSPEWRMRLLWLAGLYEYIAGNYASAKATWEKCLNIESEKSQKPMTLFWLSAAEGQLGNQSGQNARLEELMKNYPLSFYSTVAPVLAQMKSDQDIYKHLKGYFGSPSEVRQMVLPKNRVSVLEPRQILLKSALADSIFRVEAINALGQKELMEAAAVEFEKRVQKAKAQGQLTPALEEASMVYSTRLYYAAENYLSTISLTHKLAMGNESFWMKWPEHLYVFFPQPYNQLYKKSGRENHLEPEIMLGVSRQESAFTPAIESHAGALGLMQLIRPTGKKYALELKLATANIDDLLNDPESNIRIGTRYLAALNKHYGGFLPAVFAGYNAGEHAVDLWMKSRFHSDPLIFIELIPFGETKDYVKNVWRNKAVYKYLNQEETQYKVTMSEK